MATTNTPVKKTSLVDVLDSNKTVRDNISKNNEGDIYAVGTPANDAANAYWEQYGATLYPDTQLVSPEEILKDKNAPVPVTAADLMGNTALSDEQALAETAYANTQTPEYMAGIQAQAGVDVNKAYESDVSRFQTDIDALDRAIVEKRTALSAQYDQIGRGRQGTATAIQARRGLLGSDMGEQYQSELTTQTQGEKNSVIALADAEYNSQKSSIRDKQLGLTQIIRKEQSDEAALRLSASKSGSQAKLDEIKSRKTRATEAIANIIQNALYGDIDLSKPESKQALDELAKTYGTTTKTIIAQYNQGKAEIEAAAVKTQQEADKAAAEIVKLKKDSITILKEGEVAMDAEGNIIAEGNGKTVSVGEGETIFNIKTGKVVAQGPEKTSPAYKEWQDYVKSGGTSGFNEYMTMDANRKAVRISTGGGSSNPTATEVKTGRVADVTAQFQQHLGKEDGYLDTGVYDSLIKANPDLRSLFPPEEWLNPQDPTARRFFMSSAAAITPPKATTTTAADADMSVFRGWLESN